MVFIPFSKGTDLKENVIQSNPDIRELLGPEKKSLISGFGLFWLGNKGSNLGPEKISYIRVTL